MMRRLVIVFFILALITPAFALDYFGDIAANRLAVKLIGMDAAQGLGKMQYLILRDGVPMFSSTLEAGKADEVSRARMEIVNLAELDRSTMQMKQKPEGFIRFLTTRAGWANDKYEITVTIPYSVADGDPKQMLKLARHAQAEIRWRDPLGPGVDVISNVPGAGTPTTLKIETVENTLGFNNRLQR